MAERLTERLGVDAVSVEQADRERASQDFSWLSPILSENLPATTADVVAKVTTDDDLRSCLDAAHDHDAAVTPRGAGTGNYGQAVPLQGGVVVDLSRMDRILDVGDGWIDAETGARFTDLEAAARAAGQELALYPTTVQSTLGGFIAGGAGGTGTIENGFNHQGFVLDMTSYPCHHESEALTLDGDDLAPHVHTYGVTGIMARARVRLVPRREWTTVWASFDVLEDAAGVARELLTLDPLPRLVGVSEAELVRTFPSRLAVPRDRVSLRAIVDESVEAEAARLVRAAGGDVETLAAGEQIVPTLLAFNHITLWAKNDDRGIYHLQGRGRPDECAATIRECMPGARIHFDGVRYGDEPGLAAMLVAPYGGEAAVQSTIDDLRREGVQVIDPHTWRLGEHVRSVDEARRLLDRARANDPRSLLNPGRLDPVERIADGDGRA